jgi:hypothetical protein
LAAAEVSAALVVRVLPEAQLPAPARLPAPAEPPVLAQVPVLAQWQVAVRLARLPVAAHLVVDSALLLGLLSRQLFSAAMARSSP